MTARSIFEPMIMNTLVQLLLLASHKNIMLLDIPFKHYTKLP